MTTEKLVMMDPLDKTWITRRANIIERMYKTLKVLDVFNATDVADRKESYDSIKPSIKLLKGSPHTEWAMKSVVAVIEERLMKEINDLNDIISVMVPQYQEFSINPSNPKRYVYKIDSEGTVTHFREVVEHKKSGKKFYTVLTADGLHETRSMLESELNTKGWHIH